MKKVKKLTALYLIGSLAVCSIPAHADSGFFSKFFNNKYGGLAIASALTGVGALASFYTNNAKEQNIKIGLFSHVPFYLKSLGSTIKYVAKDSPFFLVSATSLLLGKNITKKIKKSSTFQILSHLMPIIGLFGYLFFAPKS